jgi:hypothetical protein
VQYDSLHEFVVADQTADHTDRIGNMVFLILPDFQITPKCIVCVSELKQCEFHALTKVLQYCSLLIAPGEQGCCTLQFLNGVV